MDVAVSARGDCDEAAFEPTQRPPPKFTNSATQLVAERADFGGTGSPAAARRSGEIGD